MVLSGIVRLCGLPGYIELLVKHPGWASQIGRLQLCHRKRETNNGGLSRSNVAPMSTNALATCESALARCMPPSDLYRAETDFTEDQDYVTVYTSALVALLPNLKGLCLDTGSLDHGLFSYLLEMPGTEHHISELPIRSK